MRRRRRTFHRRKPYYKRRRRNLIFVKLFCFFLIVVLIAVGIDMKVRPIIEKLSESQATTMATNIINEAVEQVIEDENIKYDTLVSLEKEESGTVSNVQANIVNINNFKSKVTQKITQAISSVENRVMKIPLGTLLGGSFFSGRGPKINFYISLSGSAKTKLTHSFIAAGINQTLHTISLEVQSSINIICVGYNTSTKTDTNVMIAQTVIVGKTPQTYNYINTDLEDYLENFNTME